MKNFIESIEDVGKDTETGIYMYNDSKKQRYLYLNQDFLDSGRDFGDADIDTDENSLNIYLNDSSVSEEEVATYKLYKIKIQDDYEYLKVFKMAWKHILQVLELNRLIFAIEYSN